MGMKLFDDDGDVSGELSKIEINPEFAKKYEHNKKREELQKYEELKKQGRIDSSSSDSEGEPSEDEPLIEADKKSDVKFLEALLKLKNNDPVLSKKDAKLFDYDAESDGEGEDEDEGEKARKDKKRPMYLKDVVSQHLIEAGPEFDDEDDNAGDEMQNRVKSYSEEQEELKREFLNAVKDAENDDEEGDFLKVKDNVNKMDEEEDEIGGKLNEYFGGDGKLDDASMFLKDYIGKRMWIDVEKGKRGLEEEMNELSDVEDLEVHEDYEREYNFRFEENAGDRILGHARKIEGSVRKKDNARKQQRERKEERIAQAAAEQKEELKRLKNLKKKEIREKLDKIREVAGIAEDGAGFLDEDDLEDEFDPDDYDRKMKEAFGDRYYEAEDIDPNFASDHDEDGADIEKPNFDKEDELLGLAKGWDELEKPGEGFMSTRQRILKDKVADRDESDAEDDSEEEHKEGKRKRKRKASEVEKAVREQLMEEYYKLDYEDTVGDLKTRFKYKTVKPKRYGLTPEEVLMMEDKELNQYVSLKKLAPYREKEWKVPRIKTLQLKETSKKLSHGEASASNKKDNKKRTHEMETEREPKGEGQQPAETSGDNGNISRRSKRRKRQAELKLSRSRLMAYGKIPSKSKAKDRNRA
ncbi:uncharacterized protein LOC127246387 [Andrographis paniculata]|uniref:uncharacterized protein LOC127246387 n=1 Tax=Andrographis paniculata TaxID=175694 RepID=UPI0021E90D2A|nr:uncharacterized protein LOC127246387 [Andrographis paniculata]XP_051123676.1 uncharacterized protein LOC127246387 [Andrographis paniculata]